MLNEIRETAPLKSNEKMLPLKLKPEIIKIL